MGKYIKKVNASNIALIIVTISTVTIPCLAADQTTSAKDLIYIAEPQSPPYSYQENGKLQGISVDFLEKMWERMSVDMNSSDIQLLPRMEAYDRAVKEDNAVLLLAARLPQREQLFKWAGPILSSKYVLFAKRDKNMSIDSQEDLKKYKIGAVENDLAVQLLMDKGLKKEDLILEATSTPIIEMLKNGTVDAWAYNNITGIWQINASGQNISNYKEVYTLRNIDAYLAFNKGVPSSLVQSFQHALDYIKSNEDSNGVSDYDKILSKYIPATSL